MANIIVVMNTPGQNSVAVAELAPGLAIFGIREMFSGQHGGELRGRTLGLHGFEYVARNVFRIARAFGMKVIVYIHTNCLKSIFSFNLPGILERETKEY